MGQLKGQKEYEKFKSGDTLTAKQAIKAHCYVCNGLEESSNEDCGGELCELYPFFKKWIKIKRRSGEQGLAVAKND